MTEVKADNMHRYFFPILTVLFILTNSVPGWWDMGYAYGTRSWYYILTASSLLFLGWAIPQYNKKDVLHKRFLRVLLWCMVSNLADELFFDPIHLAYNEVIFVLIIILHEFIITKRHGSSNTTN